MKAFKLLYVLPVLFVAGMISSCSEDTKDVSIVVDYPDFDMAGDQWVYLKPGDSYTDPGCKAYVDGVETEVTVSGGFDTTTPGLYYVNYSAGITEPLEANVSVTRYILVTSATQQEGVLDGTYVNNPDKITITSQGGYLYRASDTWWQQYSIPVTLADLGDGLLNIVEPQSSAFGPVANNGYSTYILDPGSITFNLNLTAQNGGAGMGYSTTWIKED